MKHSWNNWRSPIAWGLIVACAILAAFTMIVFPMKAHAETRVQIIVVVPEQGRRHDHHRFAGVRSVPNYVPGEARGIPYDAGGNRWEPTYNEVIRRNCYIYDQWRRGYVSC